MLQHEFIIRQTVSYVVLKIAAVPTNLLVSGGILILQLNYFDQHSLIFLRIHQL